MKLTNEILQESIDMFKAYMEARPYRQFKTFVESLKRTSNATLIESISAGVDVILEGFAREWFTSMGQVAKGSRDPIISYTAPSSEKFIETLQTKDPKQIMALVVPMLVRQAAGPKDTVPSDKAEQEFLKSLEYLKNNYETLINDYDPKYAPATYIANFINRPVKKDISNKESRTLEPANYHVGAKVNYDEDNQSKILPDGRNAQGEIVEELGNGKVKVRWQGVLNENPNTKKMQKFTQRPYTEDVPVDELEAKDWQVGVRTQSENIALTQDDTPEGSTTKDTGAFADTTGEVDVASNAITKDVDDAIDVIVEIYTEKFAEQGNPNKIPVNNIKALLKNGFDAYTQPLVKAKIVSDISNTKGNLKRVDADKYDATKAVADKKLINLQKQMDKINKTVSTAPTEAKFGRDLGFKTPDAAEIWGEFITVLKKQPEVIKWLNRLRDTKPVGDPTKKVINKSYQNDDSEDNQYRHMKSRQRKNPNEKIAPGALNTAREKMNKVATTGAV